MIELLKDLDVSQCWPKDNRYSISKSYSTYRNRHELVISKAVNDSVRFEVQFIESPLSIYMRYWSTKHSCNTVLTVCDDPRSWVNKLVNGLKHFEDQNGIALSENLMKMFEDRYLPNTEVIINHLT